MTKSTLVAATLVFLSIVANAFGQVLPDFESHMTRLGDKPGWRPYPLQATFHFRTLPAPLDTAVVDFSLEIVNSSFDSSVTNWPIWIDYTKGATNLMGDTILQWTGRHRAGDRLAGTLRFVPLYSGTQSIIMYHVDSFELAIRSKGNLPMPNAVYEGVSIDWCLNDDGLLTYLGSSEGKPIPCNVIGTYFFRSGQPMRTASFLQGAGGGLVDWWIELPILPTIGAESKVVYHLRALRDFPSGVDLTLLAWSMDLIATPSPRSLHIGEGDSVTLELTIRPRPVQDVQDLSLEFTDLDSSLVVRQMQQLITLGFVFNDAGVLKYMGEGQWSVPTRLLPAAYPKGSSHAEVTIKGYGR